MKFKLKALVAAVALAATAGSASAALLDTGATGNGSLFFNVWDANSSYSVNTGYTIDSFATYVAGNSSFDLTFGTTADVGTGSTLASYMTGKTALSFALTSTDIAGGRRIVSTYDAIPSPTQTSGNGRSLAGSVNSFASAVNVGLSSSANSAIFSTNSDPAYAGTFATSFNSAALVNSAGSLSNNSYATGLGVLTMTFGASGTAAGGYTPMLDGTLAVKSYLDSSNVLHLAAVQAVPEPETYGMLAAGLLMLGAVVRRRNKA